MISKFGIAESLVSTTISWYLTGYTLTWLVSQAAIPTSKVSKFCRAVSLLQSAGISLAVTSPGWYRRLQYQPIRYQSFVGRYLYYNQLVSHWLCPHLVGIAGSDGTEALVSCELVGNSTLSSCREQLFHSLTCLMVIEFR